MVNIMSFEKHPPTPNLCDVAGVEATDFLLRKIADPETALGVGKRVIGHIVSVESALNALYVAYADEADVVRTFTYAPNELPFQQTSMGDDGEPICIDC
jgi:hypothetical protein